jgi:hypothetical protein
MTSLDRFDHPLAGRYASDEMQLLHRQSLHHLAAAVAGPGIRRK